MRATLYIALARHIGEQAKISSPGSCRQRYGSCWRNCIAWKRQVATGGALGDEDPVGGPEATVLASEERGTIGAQEWLLPQPGRRPTCIHSCGLHLCRRSSLPAPAALSLSASVSRSTPMDRTIMMTTMSVPRARIVI